MHGNSYEVDAALVGRKVELVFDPLRDVSHNGSYVQLRIMWRGGSAPRWGLVVGPR